MINSLKILGTNLFSARRLLLLSLLWVLSLTNILKTSWAGDDWPVSQTPYWLQWRLGDIKPRYVLHEALYWNNQWMMGQGRFYPLTWIESRFLVSYFRDLVTYKMFSALILTLMLILFLNVVRKLLPDSKFVVAVFIGFCLTMQFRRSFDPHFAFLLMVPSILIKIFIASIFFYKSADETKSLARRVVYVTLGATFMFSAFITYEYAFVLVLIPAILLIQGYVDSGRQSNMLSFKQTIFRKDFLLTLMVLLFVWLGYAALVFLYLRPKALDISGAYVLGFSTYSFAVIAEQILATIPLLQPVINVVKGSSPLEPSYLAVIFALLLFLLTRLLMHEDSKTNGYTNSRKLDKPRISRIKAINLNYLAPGSLGTAMLITPALILAFQTTWWEQSSITNTYLGVLIQEMGLAVLIGILLRKLINPPISVRAKGKSKEKL